MKHIYINTSLNLLIACNKLEQLDSQPEFMVTELNLPEDLVLRLYTKLNHWIHEVSQLLQQSDSIASLNDGGFIKSKFINFKKNIIIYISKIILNIYNRYIVFKKIYFFHFFSHDNKPLSSSLRSHFRLRCALAYTHHLHPCVHLYSCLLLPPHLLFVVTSTLTLIHRP